MLRPPGGKHYSTTLRKLHLHVLECSVQRPLVRDCYISASFVFMKRTCNSGNQAPPPPPHLKNMIFFYTVHFFAELFYRVAFCDEAKFSVTVFVQNH